MQSIKLFTARVTQAFGRSAPRSTPIPVCRGIERRTLLGWSVCIAASMCFAAYGGHAAGAERVTPKELQPLRDAIQELISKDEDLDGVRVDCVYEDGVLRLSGIKGRPEQDGLFVELLKNHAEHLAQHNAAFVDKSRWAADTLLQISVDGFRKRLQSRLSASPQLRGVRVDRVHFDRFGNPALDGVWWPSTVAGTEADERVLLDVRDVAMKLIVTTAPDYAREGAELNVERLADNRLENPLLRIRRVISSATELDGLRVDEARYNEAGKLVLTGSYIDENQWTKLLAKLTASPDAPAWARWHVPTGADATSSRLVFDAKYITPHAELIASLTAAIRQANLATAPDGTYASDKIRIDRLFYNDKNQISIVGVRWNNIRPEEPAVLGQRFAKLIGDLWPAAVPEERDRVGDLIDVSRLVLLDTNILEMISSVVEKHSNLDGVRVDTAYYEGPMLHLVGLAADASQPVALRQILEKELDSDVFARTAPGGLVIDSPALVPLDKLLLGLRHRASELAGLDGVWISRCFYNAQRRLTCTVTAWDEVAKQSVESILAAELRKLEWAPTLAGGTAEVRIDDMSPNLLTMLREQIPSLPHLDGVRLDRAYFDERRVLRLAGLLGEERQLPHLVQLTAATIASSDTLKQYFGDGCVVNREEFEIFPVTPLLKCINEFLPGHEALDGATVRRMFHAADGSLVVEADLQSNSQNSSLERILGYALSLTDHGQRRLERNPGVAVGTDGVRKLLRTRVDVRPMPRDWSQANVIVARCLRLYRAHCYHEAVGELNKALQLDPECEAAWYVRGLCHLALNAMHLANRDLYRAVKLDAQRHGTSSDRHYFLSRIQGIDRNRFEDQCEEALLYQPYNLSCEVSAADPRRTSPCFPCLAGH